MITNMNIQEMKKIGFELEAEDIHSLDKPSLKDAVMVFGGFCTGEFVSANGLVFTNHHCGYDAVAGASTTEHNYLDNGFWAGSYDEEIPMGVCILNYWFVPITLQIPSCHWLKTWTRVHVA